MSSLIRYLARVTPQLLTFEPLLRALGVRESLLPRDYVHANTCFVRDAKEQPLSPESLKACVASLGAIVTSAVAEGSADVLTQHGSVFVPDTACVLRPVAELSFDDAPWMSTALRAQPDGAGLRFVHESVASSLAEALHACAHHGASTPHRFVHESVASSLAEALGARSLRYMLLLEEKLTDRLPCPTTEQVGRALAEGAPGMHVLMDLIEVAEALGAHAVHLLLDRRKHGTHSLLSPSLSAFQAEALCVYMPGVLLDKVR